MFYVFTVFCYFFHLNDALLFFPRMAIALGALSDFREFPCALYDILMLSQARGELYVARSQHML